MAFRCFGGCMRSVVMTTRRCDGRKLLLIQHAVRISPRLPASSSLLARIETETGKSTIGGPPRDLAWRISRHPIAGSRDSCTPPARIVRCFRLRVASRRPPTHPAGSQVSPPPRRECPAGEMCGLQAGVPSREAQYVAEGAPGESVRGNLAGKLLRMWVRMQVIADDSDSLLACRELRGVRKGIFFFFLLRAATASFSPVG